MQAEIKHHSPAQVQEFARDFSPGESVKDRSLWQRESVEKRLRRRQRVMVEDARARGSNWLVKTGSHAVRFELVHKQKVCPRTPLAMRSSPVAGERIKLR